MTPRDPKQSSSPVQHAVMALWPRNFQPFALDSFFQPVQFVAQRYSPGQNRDRDLAETRQNRRAIRSTMHTPAHIALIFLC